MIKKLTFVFLLVCFVAAQNELKVITFNTMGMKPNTAWQNRLQNSIQQLIEINPDIIGLQEINEYNEKSTIKNIGTLIMDSLKAHFGFDYQMYFQKTHVSWEIYTEGIAIISKYPIIESDFINLTPGVFNRKVIGCCIDTPIGKVNFFTTHLSYRNDHENIRIIQINEIKHFIYDKENEWKNTRSIITGDFNCTPESIPIKQMCVDKPCEFEDIHRLNHKFTFPSNSPQKKIDYIFINSKSNLKCVEESVVLNKPDQQNRFPSDHFGLMTILK